MKTLTIPLKQGLNLILLSIFTVSISPAMANSDKQAMEAVQKAREMTRQEDHSEHLTAVDESQKFRGVYYGYLPCKDCAGTKMTLSLKNKNNYLLVTQYAKASSREYYDKGKYTWDEKTRTVTLISRKNSSTSKYSIIDEGTLVPFTVDGTPRIVDQDEYALRRSDTVESREMHIH